jgi:hypothetical protein
MKVLVAKESTCVRSACQVRAAGGVLITGSALAISRLIARRLYDAHLRRRSRRVVAQAGRAS